MIDVTYLIVLLDSTAIHFQRMDSATNAEKSEKLERMGVVLIWYGRIHT